MAIPSGAISYSGGLAVTPVDTFTDYTFTTHSANGETATQTVRVETHAEMSSTAPQWFPVAITQDSSLTPCFVQTFLGAIGDDAVAAARQRYPDATDWKVISEDQFVNGECPA